MPHVRSGYSCPTCKHKTGDLNEIIADGGKFVCAKFPDHVWADPSDFLDARPTMDFAQEKPKPAPQQNHTNINISIPVPILNAIQSRYGEKLNATIAGLLSIMAEGEVMIVSDTDTQRLGQRLREKPKNAAHLIGMIFSIQSELDEAKRTKNEAIEQLKAYETMSPGKVVVDLGANLNYAADRAKVDGKPLKPWLDRQIATALENAWW